MAQGRKPQNVKVENMKDNHILQSIEALGILLDSKDQETLWKLRKEFLSDKEPAKLRGRSTVVRKQTETRLANRIAGPKVTDDATLESLL